MTWDGTALLAGHPVAWRVGLRDNVRLRLVSRGDVRGWFVTVRSRRGLLLRCGMVFALCRSHRWRRAMCARRREHAAWLVLVVCRVLNVIYAFYLPLIDAFHVCL